MKKIQNPLTVVGLFAGTAEIAGTTVLPLVSESIQNIFIWYVMGFPILLVVLFLLLLILIQKCYILQVILPMRKILWHY